MIILFGAAGSGKSLQGELLAQKYGWRWLSIGQLLRSRKDPALEAVMAQGALVDDALVVKIMHEAMQKAQAEGRRAILDGYPRNEWQAQWIVDHGDSALIEGVAVLEVSRDELWRRLTQRGRADDTREAIERRWALFDQTIAKMRKILEAQGVKTAEVDGTGPVEAVATRLEATIRGWGIEMTPVTGRDTAVADEATGRAKEEAKA